MDEKPVEEKLGKVIPASFGDSGLSFEDSELEFEQAMEQNAEIAEDICAEARLIESKAGKREAAISALSLDPHCVPAWTLLAEIEPKGSERKLGLLKNALMYASFDLPEEALEKENYPFWYDESTRPFMRAKMEFTLALYELGESDFAIENAQEILELNPNDNLGVRYFLTRWFIDAGDYKSALSLVDQFPDGSPVWVWLRAGLCARLGQDDVAKKQFAKAVKGNRHVLNFVGGKKKTPKQIPDSFGVGDESEAELVAWILAPIMQALKRFQT